MQTVIPLLGLAGLVLLLVFVVVLARRGKSHESSGGNAANTDPDLESLYSLLGDNSGRRKK